MSNEIKIATGKIPVEQRLHVSNQPPAVTEGLDNLADLSKSLKHLSTDILSMLAAGSFTEYTPARIELVSFALFKRDPEMRDSILRQFAEVSERIAAVRARIVASQSEGKSL
jgi:hypothetical protein